MKPVDDKPGDRLCDEHFHKKGDGEIAGPLVEKHPDWLQVIERVPIQVPITGKRIDIIKTVQRMFTTMWERKLSPWATIFAVSFSAGI